MVLKKQLLCLQADLFYSIRLIIISGSPSLSLPLSPPFPSCTNLALKEEKKRKAEKVNY